MLVLAPGTRPEGTPARGSRLRQSRLRGAAHRSHPADGPVTAGRGCRRPPRVGHRQALLERLLDELGAARAVLDRALAVERKGGGEALPEPQVAVEGAEVGLDGL